MHESRPVEIPLVNVNDETVRLTTWLVKEGDEVREGQNLAEVETSKALVELVASASGKIHLRVAAGEEVPVGTIVAYIGTVVPADETRQQSTIFGSSPAEALNLPVSLSGTRFSKKARELLERNKVSPDVFVGSAMVREQDVQDYLKRLPTRAVTGMRLPFALCGISLDAISLPEILAENGLGLLDDRFLESLRKNPDVIAKLSSVEKVRVYREHGAEIGEDVSIGKGTILIAPQIQLGDRVHLGDDCSVIVRERLALGALSSFREGLVIRGGTVVFGENTFAGSRIQIGGGGNADPWSVLVVGDNAYLGDDLFINICRPVILGKEVFLTQRAILVTHNIGHSILDGYENTFAPVVLEDFAQVGMNSTLYAGSRVGEGAIVGSNSYVISSIPKGKLAIGVPAHVVRDAVRPLTRQKQLQIVDTMVRQFRELLELKRVAVGDIETDPFLHFSVTHNNKTYRLGFLESINGLVADLGEADEAVLWTFESRGGLPPTNVTVIDVLQKTLHGPSGLFVDSAREFLRKRGIRLEPGLWRYEKGLI